ncbi:uncharacterized protein LOC126790992 [Argentina anserina]|uniref:uncharacterized protein LOC126790992 n=1 Tax=Argentina anserina TaxID=57926 RepID=UPI00217627DC|nr:uncharacterized protein LOC126790992 [Potentilla anserina]
MHQFLVKKPPNFAIEDAANSNQEQSPNEELNDVEVDVDQVMEEVAEDDVEHAAEEVAEEPVEEPVEEVAKELVEEPVEEPVEIEDVDLVSSVPFNISDPRNWDNLDSKWKDLLVEKCPVRDLLFGKWPKDKWNRRFSSKFYNRSLPNGETHHRDWLVYCKDLDRDASSRLFMLQIVQNKTSTKLRKGETIDKGVEEKIKKQKEHWRKVLQRLFSIVKYLARQIFAFWGTNEKMYEMSNRNFMATLEMIAEWRKAWNSHQEQMTLILRSVDVTKLPVKVEEYFVEFLTVNDTTGQRLFEELHYVLKCLDLDIDIVRDQGYDNGSVMKGKH